MNEDMDNMGLDPEGSEQQQTDDNEKKFSQQEVDEIVKKRLQRQQKKFEDQMSSRTDEQTAAAQADLTARENAVMCKEYLLENDLPLELADIIGAAEVTEFKKKVDQLGGLLQPKRQTTPPYSPEPVMSDKPGDDIRRAFSPDVRHKPKSWY